MPQTTLKTERKWALRFNYDGGDYQYAGHKFTTRDEYRGIGKDLQRAVLFDSEQDALQDMITTYNSQSLSGRVFPVPVPVDVVTETKPGSVRRANRDEKVTGYAVMRVDCPEAGFCIVTGGNISLPTLSGEHTTFRSPQAAFVALAMVACSRRVLDYDYTVVPVVCEITETSRRVDQSLSRERSCIVGRCVSDHRAGGLEDGP